MSKECKTCGEPLYVNVRRCTKCGADYPTVPLTKRTWIYAAQLAALLLAIALLVLLGGE